jgi:lipopolysaccharide export system permease protein
LLHLKTLHTYILRQVLATLLMTVVVFTFILLIGNALKQVLDLLMGGQASLGLVAKAVFLLLPYVWAFALPMAMLTACLLVFGRFSADQELTAVRASGVSLISLVAPVLFLSLVMCALCAYVNLDLAPRTRSAFKRLRSEALNDLSSLQLPEGRYIKDFDRFIFYVGKNEKGALEDVTVLYLADKTNPSMTLSAPRGKVWIDETNQQLRVKLYNAQTMVIFGGEDRQIQPGSGGEVELPPVDLRSDPKENIKPGVGTMTLSQLRSQLREIEDTFSDAVPDNLPPAERNAALARSQRSRDEAIAPIRLQMHRRMAISFACFSFTLVGIPLGIRVHRRETNIGFLIALVLVMIYYTLLLIGIGLDSHPELYPHLIVWVPTFLFQIVGGVLLWRANRGI